MLRTTIRISAIDVSARRSSASRVNATSSPEPSAMRSPSESTAVWPGVETWTSTPLRSSQSWRSASDSLALVDDVRHLVAERRHLIGDRVGEQYADAGHGQQQDQVDGGHGRPAREVRPPQQCHERVEQERDQPGDDEHQQHRPGGARERPGAEQRERQHDELDPARDHHRRDVRGRLGDRRRQRDRCLLDRLGRAVLVLRSLFFGVRFGGAHVSQYAPPGGRTNPGASTVQRVAAILFVGDIVASAGRRTLRELLPGMREELGARLRGRQRRERGRRHRHHAQARGRAVRRRRRRDHARQPHLPPPRGLALPRRAEVHPAARQLPEAPARARDVRVRARGRRDARRREHVGQPVHAGGLARRSRRSTTRSGRSPAPTTCSSTCTPRRPARRSRWAGSSTAA